MHRNEWVENADRWVAGFLEMFEEGCHKMVSKSLHGIISGTQIGMFTNIVRKMCWP